MNNVRFSYLYNRNWAEISRDERHFCIDLLFQLRENKSESQFITWVINKCKLKLNEEFDGKNFEIDVEVCYYRDLIFQYELEQGERIANKKDIKGFLKRTFDICIFLPKDIVIIEAKAAKGMTTHQMNDFKKDRTAIDICHSALVLESPRVHLVGLISHEYYKKAKHLFSANENNKYFEGIINWEQIQEEGDCGYEMPAKLRTVYSETNLISKADQMTNTVVRELIINGMNKDTSLKIH